VDLGAREYDAGTGSFISPDPLLEPDNPQDLNPYAYAYDSAPTYEDPDGACPVFDTSCFSGPPLVSAGGGNSGGGGTTGRTSAGGSDGSRPVAVPVISKLALSSGCGFLYGACPSERGPAEDTPAIRDIMSPLVDLGTDIQITPVGDEGPEILWTPEGPDLGIGVPRTPEAPDLEIGTLRTPIGGPTWIVNTISSTPAPRWKKIAYEIAMLWNALHNVQTGNTLESAKPPAAAESVQFPPAYEQPSAQQPPDPDPDATP
jgi:hypothetical protein